MTRDEDKTTSGGVEQLDEKKRARAARRRSLAEDALNIPNLLTFGRIIMIPLYLWFLDHNTPKNNF